jgi:selenocysteine-specific elongation factor
VRVIGTAGHVDHGKSTLIQALTGTHPDRLKEEQEREMTIVLGFAWWQLPNGEDVGVVDVPGHRDFIENMLSGVGGIDAALFVVAADEGVMPQTREHLAILDILQIQGGVVALTKIDAVNDPDWIDLVEEDVRQVITGTVLKDAPIVRVSAKEKTNLDELQAALEDVLAQHPRRPDLGRPRLPIDRVFTMPGFGTVVTGTLTDGAFQVGNEVEILPGGLRGRVRGLQTHKKKAETAQPGSRTAMNISGVDVDEVWRGQVVVFPDTLKPSRRLDVHFKLLGDASQPLKHDNEVKLFIGSDELLARVRLIGVKEVKPGEEAWLQLELQRPTVAVRGDRYILRRPSPGETLGGGAVLDPHPKYRHKRFAPEVIERLEALTAGTPSEVFMQALLGVGIGTYREALKASHLEKDVADQSIQELVKSNQVVVLQGDPDKITEESLITGQGFWEGLKTRGLAVLDKYHQNNPLRQGMPREELKSRLGMDAQVFNAVVARLVETGEIEGGAALVYLPGHAITFSPKQQKQVDSLMARFAQSPFSPPTIKECIEEVGEDVFQALVDLGTLLPLSKEVVFRQEDYQAAVKKVSAFIKKNGDITLAQARDHLDTTRRYVQDLLEFMDSQGITVREGDARRLKA